MTQQNTTPMTPDLARLRALADTVSPAKFEHITGGNGAGHYRIANASDDRIATSYLRENAEAVVDSLNALPALLTELETARAQAAAMREALEKIATLEQEPYTFPPDWQQQIDACPECLRYKGHPIQQGKCNTHWQPIWDWERHDNAEQKAIGPRARAIARAFLSPAAGDAP